MSPKRIEWRAMSLIELLATVAIIGILTALAVPSFRGFQVRQRLRIAQQSVQTLSVRAKQLALAPPDTTATHDTVGYGLVFYSVPAANTTVSVPASSGCAVRAQNDFVALVKYVRERANNSTIRPILNPITSPTACPSVIDPADYPEDFYMLPRPVQWDRSNSTPTLATPWLIPLPLQSVGDTYGALPIDAAYQNPLVVANNATVYLRNPSVRVGTKFLCQSLTFTRDLSKNVASVAISAGTQGSCP